VAGKRIAPAPARLDVAWTAVLTALRDDGRLPGPLVLGGRSAGARVACRTAAGLRASGVLALAFPLHPPGRPDTTP
jgi:predicted alpha/beta-hydrolase family hydrolase